MGQKLRGKIMVSTVVVLAILFFTGIMPAQAQTYQVWGQVFSTDGVTSVDDANVTVTDLNTGDSLSDITKGGGYYQTIFGPPSTDHPITIGDILQINATYGSLANITTVTATGSPQQVDLILRSAVDTIPPTYSWITRPTTGTTGESAFVNISATDNIGVTVYNITVDGAEYSMTKNGDYYTYPIPIPSGSIDDIVYNCTFKDAAANTNTTPDTTIKVTDNDEPTYSWITRPTTGTTGESAFVNISATDNIGVTVYNITVDSVEHSMMKNGDYYTYPIPIPSGSIDDIVYNCTFKDAAANTNTTPDTTIKVTDNDEPTIVEVSLNKTRVSPNESILVTVNATDNIGVINVTADNISLTAISGTWVGTIIAPSEPGEYYVTVVAKDAANNTAGDTVQYEVLFGGPCFTIELVTGYNMISLPLNDTSVTNASSLINKIGACCVEVSKWDKYTQAWKSFAPGMPPIFDFNIGCGEGLFVRMVCPANVTFVGEPCQN